MTVFKSDFLNLLQERGFIHQISDPDSLDALAARGELVGYIGFDCTAPSLHVGSMVQIMCLYWLQQTGNKPIALMGGGTTRVGDPSGKDETRKILSIEEIERNKEGIKQVFSRFLKFGEGKHDAIMPDKRDQEMSFIEFNYMILQAYDYVVLNQRYDCRLQMGGSDQWGNIVNGIDLGRRMGTPQLHALTTPLITTSSGEKMGKTASGAVWLNADMKSPYEYWQFWRNTDDADVERFLKLFTTLPLAEIERLAGLRGAEINEAKKALADSATTLLHGTDAAREAAETARKTFEEGAIAENLPSVEIPRGELEAGIGVLALFVRAGLVASNGEARRQIKGGGLRVNDTSVTDDKMVLTPKDLTPEGVMKLSLGRKRHVLVKPA